MPLLHVCHRMDNMSLETVLKFLLEFMASDLKHDSDRICPLLVKNFVKYLYEFSATQSEETFKNLLLIMEVLDVIYSIELVEKINFVNLSLVNGRVYINYSVHNSPSIPFTTLRQHLFPNLEPMFSILK